MRPCSRPIGPPARATCELIELDSRQIHPEVFTLPHDFPYFDRIERFRVLRVEDSHFRAEIVLCGTGPEAPVLEAYERSVRNGLGQHIGLSVHTWRQFPATSRESTDITRTSARSIGQTTSTSGVLGTCRIQSTLANEKPRALRRQKKNAMPRIIRREQMRNILSGCCRPA